MATVKRIRFGLVFDGARPCMDGGDFLKEIGLVEVEGVQKDGKHHLLFTVCKPRRTLDVQSAIDAYNRRHGDVIREATVTTFERGNKYLTHPICQAIQRSDASYWSWSVVMAEEQMVNDLESTLSEAPAEDMPSMEALRAQLLGLLNQPAGAFVRIINAVPQAVVNVLQAKVRAAAP